MQTVKDISQLAAAIESIQHRTRFGSEFHPETAFVSTGWPQIDHALGGGLMRGAVHEWFAAVPPLPQGEGWGEGEMHNVVRSPISEEALSRSTHKTFTSLRSARPTLTPALSLPGRGSPGRFAADSFFNIPPLAILIHLAWRAIESSSHTHPSSLIIWIGKRCWPHPRAMTRLADASLADSPNDHRLLDRSLFIDPPDDASRLWAIDLALRSSATCVVIADGTDFDMAATRRLQLAAGVGQTLSFLARPIRDLRRLSSATTRWMTSPDVSRLDKNIRNIRGRWTVELLRCKGVRPIKPPDAADAANTTRWVLELNHVTGALDLHAPLVHRLAETA